MQFKKNMFKKQKYKNWSLDSTIALVCSCCWLSNLEINFNTVILFCLILCEIFTQIPSLIIAQRFPLNHFGQIPARLDDGGLIVANLKYVK